MRPPTPGAGVEAPPGPAPRTAPRLSAENRAEGSGDTEWTFHPDQAVDHGWQHLEDPEDVGDVDPHAGGRHRMAPRVGVIVIVLALVTGGLALTHIGPFHSSPGAASTPPTSARASDIRGTWSALIGYADSLYPEPLQIMTENRSNGAFSGTITSPVGVETLKGTLAGTTMSFTISLGNATDHGVATLSASGTTVRIRGQFSSPTGGQGTIVATRRST